MIMGEDRMMGGEERYEGRLRLGEAWYRGSGMARGEARYMGEVMVGVGSVWGKAWYGARHSIW